MDDSKCKVQQNAINPNGQRSTMAGTTGVFNPPNSEMHTTKNIQIDPTSNLGAKRLDKD
jgi:hypothetical protein